MYNYTHPTPIVIKLTDSLGFEMRQRTAGYMVNNKNTTGAERGSSLQQGYGALAEIAVRNRLGMPEVNPDDHPLAYDLLLPSGVKVDVKCRGGEQPLQEEYEGGDGIVREAKHNLFARQVYDESLDTDIYLMTHLETPKDSTLPGTSRQKKWVLYICGWVSKYRVLKEGVYLPRGSLSERGRSWLQYRGQEIEFYNKNLNGLNQISEILKIDEADIEKDKRHRGDLNLTTVDSIRIIYDLIGRGILEKKHLDFIQKETSLNKAVQPMLHPNQYFHLLRYLKEKGQITDQQINMASQTLQEEPYTGI